MALVNRESVITQVRRLLRKTAPPGGVEMMSYKRNRTIALILRENGAILVRERGYVTGEQEVAPEELGRLLKTLIRREFPRSRKIRLHRFADPAELDRIHQKI
ncbi:MAG TPA: hypothetical protein ENI89_12575 [Desulfobulbus sp.]|nr:hypothetical protein [Desulfobulbus sp.]